MQRRTGLRALAVLVFGLALLLPPTAPFAALALPAVAGEGLSRWGLRTRPRVAVLIGALLACALVALIAVLVPLCGLGDESSTACDRASAAVPAMSWVFGTAAVALTVAACVWPSRRSLRYALWSFPAAMGVTLIAFAL